MVKSCLAGGNDCAHKTSLEPIKFPIVEIDCGNAHLSARTGFE